MALAHSLKNTVKDYPCVNCGADNVSIVREDAVNPRLKCNRCQFMFNGQDSKAAHEAGAIKPSSPEALAAAGDPEVVDFPETIQVQGASAVTYSEPSTLPKRPSHVFISKDRRKHQFTTKTALKQTAIKWANQKFDVYELKLIKLNVRVDIT